MSRTTETALAETALVPEVEARPRMSLLRPEVIEDAVIVSEEGHHPNFIEANTSGITLKELTKKNIIPTFSDNSLTISHQNFIGAVTKAASSRRSIRRAYIRRVQSFTPYHRTYSIRPKQESE